MQLGHKATTAEEAQHAYSESSIHYIQAAQSYPRDEETALLFFKVALEAFWYMPEGKMLGEMFMLLEQIGRHYADVQRIWEHSAASKGQNAQLAQMFSFVGRCEAATEEGKITLEDLVRPKEWVRSALLLFFVYSDSDVMHLGAVVQMGREGNHLYLKTFVPELFALSHHHRPCYVDSPKWYILLIVFLPEKGRCKRRRASLKRCGCAHLALATNRLSAHHRHCYLLIHSHIGVGH